MAIAEPIAMNMNIAMKTSETSRTLTLDGVSKRYGPSLAVNDVSLSIDQGRFVTLLGPSGSGKTTLLMMIAGFVAPTGGEIRLGAIPIGHLPPERRNFGMVFQGYALFPHLTVAENVAFPLKVRRWPKAEIDTAVRQALDSVQQIQPNRLHNRLCAVHGGTFHVVSPHAPALALVRITFPCRRIGPRPAGSLSRHQTRSGSACARPGRPHDPGRESDPA